ncbi:MAG: hypothetical protein WC428_01420 [Candidatus Paceibacterota bacterium]|jgi:hypothetical protein
MKEINLKLDHVHVEPRVIKTNITWKICECLYDCLDDECAQTLGFSNKEEYRRKMNSKKGYKEVIKMMGK